MIRQGWIATQTISGQPRLPQGERWERLLFHLPVEVVIIWAILIACVLAFVIYAILSRGKIDLVAIRKSRRDYRSPFLFTRKSTPDAPQLARLGLPALRTFDEVAALLEVTPKELRWLSMAQFNHYQSFTIEKRSGAVRLIDAPKPKLKALQRKLYQRVLLKLPLHPAAHGFCPGKNVRDHAAGHCGKQTVLGMDVANFFPSVAARRVCGLFKSWGYGEDVALLLTTLTTFNGHLPQGAPTSPALANLVFTHADARLTGLAKRFGAAYSRYADDMSFSGDQAFQRKVSAFSKAVEGIVKEEGFQLNHNKTRMMRHGRRQIVTGLVVNDAPHVSRRVRRRARAMLHNARKSGLPAQNRFKHPRFAEHVRGRIAWIAGLHPRLGAMLLEDWRRAHGGSA